jgi:carboxyl-terminal processing protease
MKIKILLLLLLTTFLASSFAITKANEFNAKGSWVELKSVLKQQYAYLDRPDFNVDALFNEFEVRAIDAKTKQEFADISQMLLRHFYDPHLNLGPYDENDFSVFPTGSDIRAVYVNSHFIIEDVKAGSAAAIAGIRPGAEILTIDDLPATKAVEKVFGKKLKQLSLEQVNYGVNISLGGLREKKRIITLKSQERSKTFHLASSYAWLDAIEDTPTLNYKKLNDVGYIRFNNSLGNSQTVDDFKEAISALSETNALIIDLRNTPSGGNTSVAEPILGHFVDKKTAYQLYQIQKVGVLYKDAIIETAYVAPNTPQYTKPFVVLAGRWTGSMGEGMTIGLDAIGAATVIGAPMADLLGGIKTIKLVESDTWIELGFERLYHVNNTYREDFEPHIMVNPTDLDVNGNDPALTRARQFLAKPVADSL